MCLVLCDLKFRKFFIGVFSVCSLVFWRIVEKGEQKMRRVLYGKAVEVKGKDSSRQLCFWFSLIGRVIRFVSGIDYRFVGFVVCGVYVRFRLTEAFYGEIGRGVKFQFVCVFFSLGRQREGIKRRQVFVFRLRFKIFEFLC